MDLFDAEKDLERYLFRIVDNGGESFDRITVIFSDGDYVPCSLHSRCASGEGIDVQGPAENVEAGTERDLRWIDLDAGLRRDILAWLNQGFADWLGSFSPHFARFGVEANGTAYRLAERVGEGVYGKPGAYFVKREGDDPADDLGPYETLAEAVRETLPDAYDLAGEEYHPTVDLWDETGGPCEPWDREADPPVIDEHNDKARVALIDTATGETVARFATGTDAENYMARKLDEEDGDYRIDNPDGW